MSSSPALTASLPFVLRWEGGFVDHPNDPGGTHQQGRHAEGLRRLAPAPGLPHARRQADRGRRGPRDLRGRLLDAAALRPAAAPLDLVQFDTAVNMGSGRAVRFLQRAVGCGVDGDFGPATERRGRSCDLGNAIATYCDAREDFYRRLAPEEPEARRCS